MDTALAGFFDGEEAVKEWTDADSAYGSRILPKMAGGRDAQAH